MEYTTIFSALDIRVTLIELRDTMLDFIDQVLIGDFTHQLCDRGMVLGFGSKTEKLFTKNAGKAQIDMADGRTVRSDIVLFAAGRMGATQSLNLDACGFRAIIVVA